MVQFKTFGARILILCALGWIEACPGAPAQPSALRSPRQNTYSSASNVVTWPLPKLTKSFRELRGLKPATSQEELPSLLDRVGKCVRAVWKNLPSTVAQEDIVSDRLGYSGLVVSTTHQRDDYFVMARSGGGETNFDEYRAASKGGRVLTDPSEKGLILTYGFAQMWVVFAPGNRARSDFRYLGRQRVNRQWTYVIAFAERPGDAPVKGEFGAGASAVKLIYQGIAWVADDDFHVVRLRSDLLTPHPEIKLDRLTTLITFGEVHFPTVSVPLWLPYRVIVTTIWGRTVYQNRHTYSDYRLFNVQSKILPVKP